MTSSNGRDLPLGQPSEKKVKTVLAAAGGLAAAAFATYYASFCGF